MKFEEALAAMREGKKVRRESHINLFRGYVICNDEIVEHWVDEASYRNMTIASMSSDEITADDWQIVD